MSLISINNLSVAYGDRQVLSPISLDIRQGEVVALVGASGAGKSTLLTSLYQQTGSNHLPFTTAWLPQELGLVYRLSVFHNAYMGRLHERSALYHLVSLIKPRKQDTERILPILKQVGIEDKIWALVETLSGGQKQRTAIARVIYQNADFLLADEPVSALDGPMAEQVMRVLTQTYQTAVIAMHDIKLALAYSDRLIAIGQGKILIDAPTADVSMDDIERIYDMDNTLANTASADANSVNLVSSPIGGASGSTRVTDAG